MGIFTLFISSLSYGWADHLLITYGALKDMPEVSQEPTIPAETLTHFVTSESDHLIPLLATLDDWSGQLIHYPKIPDELIFKGSADTLKPFTDRLRINPEMHYDALFVQYPPGQPHRLNNPIGKEAIVLPAILSVSNTINLPLEKMDPGTLLSPFEIILSAVDEPDFGMDINLFEDNGTEYGKRYKFGKAPDFVNNALAVGTQAPFHMSFFYEGKELYWVASYLKCTYPEYRIHAYLALSQQAFKDGHFYWGYRFLGWALHYCEDLSQPYHARLSPNTRDTTLMFDKVFKKTELQNIKQAETNKHFALENYQYGLLQDVISKPKNNNRFLEALGDRTHDAQDQMPYTDLYPRNTIAKESFDNADLVDNLVCAAFKDYVVPSYHFSETGEVQLYQVADQNDPNIQNLNKKLEDIFRSMGSHIRKIVRYATIVSPHQ